MHVCICHLVFKLWVFLSFLCFIGLSVNTCWSAGLLGMCCDSIESVLWPDISRHLHFPVGRRVPLEASVTLLYCLFFWTHSPYRFIFQCHAMPFCEPASLRHGWALRYLCKIVVWRSGFGFGSTNTQAGVGSLSAKPRAYIMPGYYSTTTLMSGAWSRHTATQARKPQQWGHLPLILQSL